MKTTLDLPDDLMREVKVRAAKEGRKLKDVVAESIRLGLASRSRHARKASGRARITVDPDLGFPLVKCPANAPARRMSAEGLQRLIDEDQQSEDLNQSFGWMPTSLPLLFPEASASPQPTAILNGSRTRASK